MDLGRKKDRLFWISQKGYMKEKVMKVDRETGREEMGNKEAKDTIFAEQPVFFRMIKRKI